MKVVAVGAHPDDVELGVGGTLRKHVKNEDDVTILHLTMGGAIANPAERASWSKDAAKILGVEKVKFGAYQDTRMICDEESIGRIESFVKRADRVYTHSKKDSHQDHRNTALATVAAARRCRQILAYETPSTMPSFTPQFYVPLELEDVNTKTDAIEVYNLEKKYMEAEACKGLARFRGLQSNNDFAEAFKVVRFEDEIEWSGT